MFPLGKRPYNILFCPQMGLFWSFQRSSGGFSFDLSVVLLISTGDVTIGCLKIILVEYF